MTFQKVTLTFELSIDSFNDLKMDTNLKLRKWTMTLTFMIFFLMIYIWIHDVLLLNS